MTKKEWYEELINIVNDTEYEDKDAAVGFLQDQIDILDRKAERAAERAAARKEAGDEMRQLVLGVLTDEPQYVDDIMEQVEGEDITRGKIVARLTQLVKAGAAVKETIDKHATYRLA